MVLKMFHIVVGGNHTVHKTDQGQNGVVSMTLLNFSCYCVLFNSVLLDLDGVHAISKEIVS